MPFLRIPSQALAWRIINWLYSTIVLTLPGKLIILIVTVAITTVAGFGASQLKQWFDPNWFLPKGSYLSDYIIVHNQQFPSRGYPAGVFIGEIDYIAEYSKIITLTEKFNNMSTIYRVETWPQDFAKFVDKYYAKGKKLIYKTFFKILTKN